MHEAIENIQWINKSQSIVSNNLIGKKGCFLSHQCSRGSAEIRFQLGKHTNC